LKHLQTANRRETVPAFLEKNAQLTLIKYSRVG